MSKIKTALLRNSGLNVLEYTLVYLVKSFVIWEFTNPFQWIIDIPTYQPDTRGLILFAIALWQGIQIMFCWPGTELNKEFSKSK